VNTLIGTFSASDVDSSSFTYTIASTAYFYSAGASLYVAKVIDYEATPTLTVAVTATDAGGLSLSLGLTIAVGNVNEAPLLITLSNAKVDVGHRQATAVSEFCCPSLIVCIVAAWCGEWCSLWMFILFGRAVWLSIL
jgi:hypothetical protein